MIVGNTIFKLDGNPYYSSEIWRGGLAATFALMVTQASGTPTVIVTVQHRNNDETTFTTAGTFASVTAVGDYTVDVSGLKEVIRLGFGFDAGDAATDAIHVFVQSPSWRPY